MHTFFEAFEKDNARTESMRSIIETFVPTDEYWDLFSRQHQIVLGCRGSGKTALMKMISFPYVMESGIDRAFNTVTENNIIGIHVSTDIRFTGSLKNKIWTNEEQEERYFIWKLNINVLKSLLSALPSILKKYARNGQHPKQVEVEVCGEINRFVFGKNPLIMASELIDKLDDYETEQQHELISKFREPGIEKVHIDVLSGEILSPLNSIFRILKKYNSKFDDVSWFICIDEAEFLTDLQMRILNSFMRTFSGNIFMKVATMPFSHSTKDTNINVPVFADDDLKYIYLDNSPDRVLNEQNDWVHQFANTIFEKRIAHHLGPDVRVSLDDVLGSSEIDEDVLTRGSLPRVKALLQKHCDERTVARAAGIVGNRKNLADRSVRQRLSDQIWRKVSGAIRLREAQSEARGNRQYAVYNGKEIFVRCTDGVPRRMINLFYAVSKEVHRNQQKVQRRSLLAKKTQLVREVAGVKLSKNAQSRLLRQYSDLRYQQIESVPKSGIKLREFIDTLNAYYFHKLHQEKLSTDLVSMFKVTQETPEELWRLIKAGVEYGYIFPNRTKDARIYRPTKSGSYRLAFALAPRSSLMPRRGKAIAVQSIIRISKRHRNVKSDAPGDQLQLKLGDSNEG
ncbi:MAG: hypothetical protein AAGB04_14420 [Pseudomonadota bacterium]